MTREYLKAVDQEASGVVKETSNRPGTQVKREGKLRKVIRDEIKSTPGSIRIREKEPPPPLDENPASKRKRFLVLLVLGILGWAAWHRKK